MGYSSTDTTLGVIAKLAALELKLQQNPNDVTTLLEIATICQQIDDLRNAAVYLERVITADPAQKEVYLRLANIYMNSAVSDYTAAVVVLNKAVKADPNNPDVFLKLGIAQNTLGNKSQALLACRASRRRWRPRPACCPTGWAGRCETCAYRSPIAATSAAATACPRRCSIAITSSCPRLRC